MTATAKIDEHDTFFFFLEEKKGIFSGLKSNIFKSEKGNFSHCT